MKERMTPKAKMARLIESSVRLALPLGNWLKLKQI